MSPGPNRLERRLAGLTRPAVVPGLERVRALLRRLGDPQRGLRVLHVAGTNGKGSVCRMLEGALLASGRRAGLFTSPHLVRFNERFRFLGRSAGDRALEASAAPLWAALEAQAAAVEGPATVFEALTALAFLHFRRVAAEVVVLEAGLGGRLDSTNVVERPLLTLITNISLDHTRELGRTEAAIAFEKAGILKPGSPLVTAASGKARAVILRRFRRVQGAGSRTSVVALRPDRDWRVLECREEPEEGRQRVVMAVGPRVHTVDLPLLGAHQHQNLACVLAACGLLERRLELDPASVARGLARAHWPGRLQVLSRRPLTLLDGAHNPGGAKALADFARILLARRRPRRVAWVVGVLADKDWKRMFRCWMGLAGRWFVAEPPDPRALPVGEAVRWLKRQGASVQGEGSLPRALERARIWAGPDGVVVAAGSLYGAGVLLRAEGVIAF